MKQIQMYLIICKISPIMFHIERCTIMLWGLEKMYLMYLRNHIFLSWKYTSHYSLTIIHNYLPNIPLHKKCTIKRFRPSRVSFWVTWLILPKALVIEKLLSLLNLLKKLLYFIVVFSPIFYPINVKLCRHLQFNAKILYQ